MHILIDGENLRHQIAKILYKNKKITENNAYFAFNLANFLEELLDTKDAQIIYYTTKIKLPRQRVPIKLKKRISTISESNRRWIADLTNQKIKVIKAGYLRVRESSSCVHCGKKTLVLQEKGVDVRIASDLVLARDNLKEKTVVLGSSDSDLVPAMQAAKRGGVKISYICYAGWLNRSVAAQAHKVITFDDSLVLKHYKDKA